MGRSWWLVAWVAAWGVVGCGEDEAARDAGDAGDAGEDVGGDAGEDVGGDAGDVGGDAGDVGGDAGEDVGQEGCGGRCEAALGERCVAERCVGRFDRACADDTDCRAHEVCQEVGGASACVRGETPTLVCPGGEGCASNEGPLLVGAAAVVTTPPGFEQARAGFMDGNEFVGDPDDPDTFVDCGLDQRCPGDPGYSAPDFGEDDGHMQGAWLAGFGHSRPAFRWCGDMPQGRCVEEAPWEGELAHDDIYARALVLEQGELTIGLVVIDAVGYFYDHQARVEALLPEDVRFDALILAATHDHEAPDMLGQWGPGAQGDDLPVATGAERWWTQHTNERVAQALTEAYRARVPAKVQAAPLKTGAQGFAVGDGRDPWIFDDALPAMRFSTLEGDRTLATVLSWGQHPEVRDDNNLHITSDFPGPTRRYMEEGLPEVRDERGAIHKETIPGAGGVSLFFAGALGGLIGPGGETAVDRQGRAWSGDEWEKVDAVGQRLAELALLGLQEAPAQESPRLSFATREYTVPIENLQFHTAIYGLQLFDRDLYNATPQIPFSPTNVPHVLTRSTVVRLGRVTLFTMPGEAFPEMMVGGYSADVRYRYEPVQGDANRLECAEDLRPVECAEGAACPEGWRCLDGRACSAEGVRCGDASTCAEDEACERGRCARRCADASACGLGFGCEVGQGQEEGLCRFEPALAQAEGLGYPCLVSPGNPNPPDLDQAPQGPYLKERMPGEVLFMLGLAHDELGYINPPYDFKLDEDGPYILEPPGDHYTETNSTGPGAWDQHQGVTLELLEALGE